MSTAKDRTRLEPFIFIAYHTAERSYAILLRKQLVALGFTVWWDQNVKSGEEWNEEIARKLHEASCVVVLWSWRALESDWVKHEASTANASKKYAPCKLENIDVVGPHGRFQVRNLVGWDGSSGTAEFPGLIESCETLLGKSRNKDVTLTTEFLPWPPMVPRSTWDRVFAHVRPSGFFAMILVALTISALTYRSLAKLQSDMTNIQNVSQQAKQVIDQQQFRIESIDSKVDYVISELREKK